jgi:hypothetical protein
LRLLWPALRFARHLRQGLLGPFLSGNMCCGNFSTPFRADVSVKKSIKQGISFPAAETLRQERTGEMNLVHLEGIRDHRTSTHRRAESGAGRLKAVLFLAVLVFAIYSAVKIVPIYISNYQLSDKMQEQARFGVVNRYTEDQIRDNIFKFVQELDIPVKREAIKVVSTNAIVKISMDYTVPVDLLFYHAEFHFSPSSENKSLF